MRTMLCAATGRSVGVCQLVVVQAKAVALVVSQSPVYTYNQLSQPVTSSTLQWVTNENGNRPMHTVGAENVGTNVTVTHEKDLFVCRAAQRGGGSFHGGHLVSDGCLVSIAGEHQMSFRKYHVLVNVDLAARMEWKPWKQFQRLPRGAVSVDSNIFVARVAGGIGVSGKDEGPSLGGIYVQEDQFGVIHAPGHRGTSTKHSSGDILVEHEPAWFEMTNFFHGKQTSESYKNVHLADQVKIIWDNSWSGQTFNVTYQRSVYFGRGHSIPVGSLVKLTFRNKSTINLVWGVPKMDDAWRQVRLTYPVPADSQVRVTLGARQIRRKFEFTATLLTHFKDDDVVTERPIKGRYSETTFDRFAPFYGNPMPAVDYRSVHFKGLTSLPSRATQTKTTQSPSTFSHENNMARPSRINSMLNGYRYPLEKSPEDLDHLNNENSDGRHTKVKNVFAADRAQLQKSSYSANSAITMSQLFIPIMFSHVMTMQD